ncbi:MAG: hypothetical protein LBL99_01300 [Holosporaceae bacterium]|jgi:hypothetical protein|nr:hypothetical protein [Holosporaceae bacterium]
MKKVLFALGALAIAPAWAADNAAANHNGVDPEEIVADEHPAYEGWYAGFGFHAANVGVRNDYTYGTRYHGAAGYGGAPAVAAGDWATIGLADLPGTEESESDDRNTRLGGSIVLGFGKKLKTNGAYFGIEAGLDFSPASNYYHAHKVSALSSRLYDIETKVNGIVPSISLKGGFVDCATKILTYLKVGAAYTKMTEHYWESIAGVAGGAVIGQPVVNDSIHKCSTLVPIIAIGIEKAFAKRMTARLEMEYKFPKSKIKDFGEYGKTKLTQKTGITLRALFCAHVKVGL